MKRLGILLGLAALVWAGFYLLPEPKDGSDAPPDIPWPTIAPATLDRAEAWSSNGTSFVLEKEGGAWFIKTLGEDPSTRQRLRATRGKAEALANFFNANAPQRILEDVNATDDATLAQFGLDDPVKRLVLIDKGVRTGLAFGSLNPDGTAVYATMESTSPESAIMESPSVGPAAANATRSIYLLNKSWLDQAIDPSSYYDLQATDLLGQNIHRLRLATPEHSLEIERNGTAQFRFLSPQDYQTFEVNPMAAENLLHAVGKLEGVALANATIPKDAEPVARLDIWPLASNASQTIAFYPVADNPLKYFLRADYQPAVFFIDRASLGRIVPSPFELRDRRILSLDPAQVDRMRLVALADGNLTTKDVTVVRGGGVRPAEDLPSKDWTREDSNASISGLDTLLWQLSELAFEAAPVENRPITAIKTLRWELFDTNGTALAKVIFARDLTLPEGQCWATLQDNGDQSSWKTLFPVADDLLEQTLATVFPGSAAAPPAE